MSAKLTDAAATRISASDGAGDGAATLIQYECARKAGSDTTARTHTPSGWWNRSVRE